MQWGHFVCHSSSQKRESTAFDLILHTAWGLLSPSKQGGRSSTPCRKRSQVWGRESERWPKYIQSICNRAASVGNGKNKLSPIRVKKGFSYYTVARLFIHVVIYACSVIYPAK